jgi:hypothetical protein
MDDYQHLTLAEALTWGLAYLLDLKVYKVTPTVMRDPREIKGDFGSVHLVRRNNCGDPDED